MFFRNHSQDKIEGILMNLVFKKLQLVTLLVAKGRHLKMRLWIAVLQKKKIEDKPTIWTSETLIIANQGNSLMSFLSTTCSIHPTLEGI